MHTPEMFEYIIFFNIIILNPYYNMCFNQANHVCIIRSCRSCMSTISLKKYYKIAVCTCVKLLSSICIFNS